MNNNIKVHTMYSVDSKYWNDLHENIINIEKPYITESNIVYNFVIGIKIIKPNFNKNNMCNTVKNLIKNNNENEIILCLLINNISSFELKKLILCIEYEDKLYFAIKFSCEKELNLVYNYLIKKMDILAENIKKPIKENLKEILNFILENKKNISKIEELITKWIFKDYITIIINEFKKSIKINDTQSINLIYNIIFSLFKAKYCPFFKKIFDDSNYKYFLLMIKKRNNIESINNNKDFNIKKILKSKFNNIFDIKDSFFIESIKHTQKLLLIYDVFFNNNKITIYSYFIGLINYFSKLIVNGLIEKNIDEKLIWIYNLNNIEHLINFKVQLDIIFENILLNNRSIYKEKFFSLKFWKINFEKLKFELLNKNDKKIINYIISNIRDVFINNFEIYNDFNNNFFLKEIILFFLNEITIYKIFIDINQELINLLKNPNININKDIFLNIIKYFNYLYFIKNISDYNIFLFTDLSILIYNYINKDNLLNKDFDIIILYFEINSNVLKFLLNIKYNKYNYLLILKHFINKICILNKNKEYFKDINQKMDINVLDIIYYILINLKNACKRRNLIYSKFLELLNYLVKNKIIDVIHKIKKVESTINTYIPNFLKNSREFKQVINYKVIN